jgi:hypothetical protein
MAGVQKIFTKFIDVKSLILIVARTSAVAGRYAMYGKGGWPHLTGSAGASSGGKFRDGLKPGERANEINTESV